VVARLVVLTSFLVLVLSAAMSVAHGETSYTREEVVEAFARQEWALGQLEGGGWTAYAPFADPAGGSFLFPEPIAEAPFYVFVARTDQQAEEFFAPLARAGGGPRVFDMLQGNVVVNSDASLTDVGLTTDERRRIRAALQDLSDDEVSSANSG
jgi:hypothetical protein